MDQNWMTSVKNTRKVTFTSVSYSRQVLLCLWLMLGFSSQLKGKRDQHEFKKKHLTEDRSSRFTFVSEAAWCDTGSASASTGPNSARATFSSWWIFSNIAADRSQSTLLDILASLLRVCVYDPSCKVSALSSTTCVVVITGNLLIVSHFTGIRAPGLSLRPPNSKFWWK